LDADVLRRYFTNAYTAPNLIISAVGNLDHARVRPRRGRFAAVPEAGAGCRRSATVVPKILIRNKELEQSHLCLGASSYPQNHNDRDRYSSYVLNTLLGGSMSSRLFQNIREKRGLAYAVFSGLSAYRDAGSFTVYAGCSNDAVDEVVDLVVEELGVGMRRCHDGAAAVEDHLRAV
jgi:predicted Zn-dependent peptidase